MKIIAKIPGAGILGGDKKRYILLIIEMTIEGSVAAPQAATDTKDDGIGGISSVDDYSNNSRNSHLESLIQRLTQQARETDERSIELAERVALLEEGSGHCFPNNTHNNNNIHGNKDDTNNRRQSKRKLRVSFRDNQQQSDSTLTRSIIQRSIIQRADSSNDDNNNSSSLKLVTGIPEDDNNNNDEKEEMLSDRITLLEQQLESYAEEKDNILLNDDRKYLLPESTFSLLVTHHPISIPFCFSVFSVTLSISCLVLTLASSISKGTNGNRLGIPAGVDKTVRAAQFLGKLVICVVVVLGCIMVKCVVYIRCKICAHLVFLLIKESLYAILRISLVSYCFPVILLLCIVSRLFLGAIVGVLMEGKRKVWCTLCVLI